jgi:hypothetical protein
MVDSMQTAKSRAADALKAVLHQISQIKVSGIDIDSPRPDLKIDILAHLEVLGHNHTLVCKVEASGRPEHVRVALDELRGRHDTLDGNTTVVFIAPRVSEEAQALCRECRAGFLDLEGNARIDLGEVFIVKRTLPPLARKLPVSISRRVEAQLAGVA